jgi:hypothetical protein
MESQQYRPKGLLFHYTSAEGLAGILKSGNIFATHIRYLNDSQELFDCLAHVEGFISEFDPIMRPKLKSFLESSVRMFATTVGAYVASFTDDAAALVGTEQAPGDRLNQWRAYCSPGKGFSLGFDSCVIDKSGLGERLEGIDPMAYLHNCIYSSDMKRSILQGVGGLVAGDMEQSVIDGSVWLFKEAVDHGQSREPIEALTMWMQKHVSSKEPLHKSVTRGIFE